VAVLTNAAAAPVDLAERAIYLAGQILDFDPALKGGTGAATARRLLSSGAAWAAMQRIVAAQGPAKAPVTLGHLTHEVRAARAGHVAAIDCYRLARIARLAGAPVTKGAGIDLLKKVGDPVAPGEPLYRIHADLDADFGFATDMAAQAHGYTLQ